MKCFIIVNENIYKKYKEDILPLNARLFTNPYFYDLANYKTPSSLTGIIDYLKYFDEISIYTSSTFLDFVNILLIVSFFKEKNYQKKIEISYFLDYFKPFNEAVIIKNSFTINDFDNVDDILKKMKNNEKIDNIKLPLLGTNNYLNFYNLLSDNELFNLVVEELIDKYDNDLKVVAKNLESRYSNMALSSSFYEEKLKQLIGE